MTEANDSLRVVVLAGGDSPEREVSLRSGAAVAEALIAAGHHVTLLDPAQTPLAEVAAGAFDACFVALHGGAGEDGRVQEALEHGGIPYTGSGPEACRWAMSKSESKQRFCESGVPTPNYVVFNTGDAIAEIAERVQRLGYPLIVKPDGQGSSLGVGVAETADALPRCIEQASAYDETCLIEPMIVGREFTVAVLEDRALPTLEIVAPESVFSYEAKYQSARTEYCFDFELCDRLRAEIPQIALAAARALGTRSLARVDLMVDHDSRAWVLEVNTIPGMTARSLAPQAALRAGLDMPALCDRMVRACLRNFKKSSRKGRRMAGVE